MWYCFFMLYSAQTFKPVDETLVYDHSKLKANDLNSYVQKGSNFTCRSAEKAQHSV